MNSTKHRRDTKQLGKKGKIKRGIMFCAKGRSCLSAEQMPGALQQS